MKRLSFRGRSRGFTLLEVLVVIAIVAVFYLLILPLGVRSDRSPDMQCLSNLRQGMLGLIMWRSDHNDKFPWQLSVANDGTLEQITSGRVAPHFQILSNYALSPRILVCPTDKKRRAGTSLSQLQENQISYFINLDTVTNNPASTMLVGDRHLEANGNAVAPGLFTWTTNLTMGWTRELHSTVRQPIGYVGFTDGHGQQVKDLTDVFQKQALETDRLAVP